MGDEEVGPSGSGELTKTIESMAQHLAGRQSVSCYDGYAIRTHCTSPGNDAVTPPDVGLAPPLRW